MKNRVSEFNEKTGVFYPDRIKALFIHIPKTGGTSVRTALYGRRIDGRCHASVNAYDNIESYYKFSVIRDPVERLMSLYHFVKDSGRRGWWNIPIRKSSSFDEFCKKIPEMYDIGGHPGLYTQSFWIENDGMRVDELFKFGRFDLIEETIMNKFGVSINIKHRKKSTNRSDDFISSESMDIVSEIYHRDFELYNMVSSGVWSD